MWPYVYMLIIWVLVWTELWLNVRKNSKSIFTLIFCLTNMSSWDLLLWRMSSYLVTKIVHIVSLHRLVNMITCTCTMYIGRFYPKKTMKELRSLHVHCNDVFRYLNSQRLFSIVLVIIYQILLHVTLLPPSYGSNVGSPWGTGD